HPGRRGVHRLPGGGDALAAVHGATGHTAGGGVAARREQQTMTEQEWLEATTPKEVLTFLEMARPRKLRLFACACARRVWGLLPDEFIQRGIEIAEGYADDRVTIDSLAAAFRENAPFLGDVAVHSGELFSQQALRLACAAVDHVTASEAGWSIEDF